ncbi:geranylgeranyl reductase family protein [Salipiger sp. P9]|uniref:NAD(P)/FAD-dependent oxidoreductase n=1 Tax=Salipiger pentaromativorans TaxID=2943193 RepID=UPI0021577A81|nr:geranylgeranyl reductase family protein [Salipiger pentaromativorans]MCR8547840.1 geranylgeranyl reductase family protein [Salipiger pentaromativorans]
MTTRFDLIVLGAGPAGATAARVAARAGLRVALIDKAVFPRDKLCGGLITGRCLGHLTALGALPPPGLLTRQDRVTFFRNGAELGTVSGCPPVYLTTRHAFDHHLLTQARAAGAEDLTGTRVQEIGPAHVTLASGPRLGFSALIGADGVNSAVARQLFGAAFDPATIGFALETEAPPDPEATLRIDFGAARWGYGWRFPKPGSTTIGVGGLHARNPGMKAAMARYLAEIGAAPDLRIKGHFLPFGSFRAHPGRGAVLLTGDAAGLVDPITGEGIGHAVHSGRLAAESIVAALAAGVPDSALRRYRQALRPLHRDLRLARMLRPLLFSERLGPRMTRVLRGSESARMRYMALLAGETDYPEFLAHALRRLPARLLRA